MHEIVRTLESQHAPDGQSVVNGRRWRWLRHIDFDFFFDHQIRRQHRVLHTRKDVRDASEDRRHETC